MSARLLAGSLAFIAISGATTVPAQVSGGPVPERATVEQKRALVARILTDVSITDGIARGKSTEAREKLATAGHLHKRALELLDKGEIAAADRSLNDAIAHIGKARMLLADAGRSTGEAQSRFTRLVENIEALEVSYLRNVGRRGSWLAEMGDEDLKRVRILVKRAQGMAASGQAAEANALLERAQRDLILSYNNLLGTAPMIIVYDLRFGSPEEEYKYESERRHDYEGLVPVAIREYKPSRESLEKVDRLVEESRAIAAVARSHAEQRQFQAALTGQREAIAKLQQALEAAGVVVPQRIPN